MRTPGELLLNFGSCSDKRTYHEWASCDKRIKEKEIRELMVEYLFECTILWQYNEEADKNDGIP